MAYDDDDDEYFDRGAEDYDKPEPTQCPTCGGSGGGPEHWVCGTCNGRGEVRG